MCVLCNILLLLLQEVVTRAYVLVGLAGHTATYRTWAKLLSRSLLGRCWQSSSGVPSCFVSRDVCVCVWVGSDLAFTLLYILGHGYISNPVSTSRQTTVQVKYGTLVILSCNSPQTNSIIPLFTFALHPSWPVMVCAFLLHQHHKRSGMRRGERGGEGKGQPPSPCTHTPNLLQLHLLHLPTANGQTHAPVNPNIASTTLVHTQI